MPPDIPQKFNVIEGEKPICVIQKQSLAFVKRKVSRKLRFDLFTVRINFPPREQFSHLRSSAGISYRSRSAAKKSDRPVAAALHVHKAHDGYKAAHMQRIGRGIKSNVAGNPLFSQESFQGFIVRGLVDKASLLQNAIHIVFHPFSLLSDFP